MLRNLVSILTPAALYRPPFLVLLKTHQNISVTVFVIHFSCSELACVPNTTAHLIFYRLSPFIHSLFSFAVCGSVTLWYGSGSGSCYFCDFCPDFFFGSYFLKLHLHNFSKIRSRQEVKKQKESRFFLICFDGRRIRSRTSGIREVNILI